MHESLALDRNDFLFRVNPQRLKTKEDKNEFFFVHFLIQQENVFLPPLKAVSIIFHESMEST